MIVLLFRFAMSCQVLNMLSCATQSYNLILFIYLFVYLFIYLFIYIFTCLFVFDVSKGELLDPVLRYEPSTY